MPPYALLIQKDADEWCVLKIAWEHDENMYSIEASNVRHPLSQNCVGNPVPLKSLFWLRAQRIREIHVPKTVASIPMAHTAGTCLAES